VSLVAGAAIWPAHDPTLAAVVTLSTALLFWSFVALAPALQRGDLTEAVFEQTIARLASAGVVVPIYFAWAEFHLDPDIRTAIALLLAASVVFAAGAGWRAVRPAIAGQLVGGRQWLFVAVGVSASLGAAGDFPDAPSWNSLAGLVWGLFAYPTLAVFLRIPRKA
jgi:hypothetical protein